MSLSHWKRSSGFAPELWWVGSSFLPLGAGFSLCCPRPTSHLSPLCSEPLEGGLYGPHRLGALAQLPGGLGRWEALTGHWRAREECGLAGPLWAAVPLDRGRRACQPGLSTQLASPGSVNAPSSCPRARGADGSHCCQPWGPAFIFAGCPPSPTPLKILSIGFPP